MATSDLIHELKSDHWHIGVLPGTGASLAYGKLNHDGGWYDFLRPTHESNLEQVNDAASYPLIPWSNRIRDAVFTYGYDQFRLQPSWPDGTAIHGAARHYSWDTVSSDEAHIRLAYDSREYSGVNWPFDFTSEILYRVEGDAFTVTTQITNVDARTMPVGFGHHPFYQKNLTSADDRASIQIPFARAFTPESDGVLPLYQPAEPVTQRTNFLDLRRLPDDSENIFIDDCYTGRLPDQPVRFVYPSGVEVHLESDPIFQSLVFYCPVGQDIFAIEPVTNSNDGFNMLARAIPDNHVIELQSGDTVVGSFTFRKVK